MKEYLDTMSKYWNQVGFQFNWPNLRDIALREGKTDFPEMQVHTLSHPAYKEMPPSLKASTLDILQDLRVAQLLGEDTAHVEKWCEKLLRVCEIRQFNLRKLLLSSDGRKDILGSKTLLLCLLFLEVFQRTGDPRFVNITLKMLDQPWVCSGPEALTALAKAPNRNTVELVSRCCVEILLQESLRTIASSSWSTEIITSEKDSLKPLPSDDAASLSTKQSVVVFSPNRYSLYTLGVVELLQRRGIKVRAIVICKLLNPSRFFREFRRDGKRLLKKIWKKLFLRRRAYGSMTFQTMPEFLASLDVCEKSVDEIAKKYSSEVVYCKDLNSSCIHNLLDRIQPDTVLFTGGGLIRRDTLERSGAGVVNCHMGQLPAYKGMDVVEWPILENHPEAIGFTVHYMDEGIDTGDIIAVYSVPTEDHTIKELRIRMEPLMTRAIVDAITRFFQGEYQPISQQLGDGKQFFIMHEKLYAIAQERFCRTPFC